MTNRKHIIISVALIGAALLAVAVFTLTGDRTAAEPNGMNMSMDTAPDPMLTTVRMSAEQAQRIGISYAVAEAGTMTRVIRTVAGVTFDETRVHNVNPKIEGWVEKLYVDFTGAPIRKGQPLMAVYSPMLVSAQEELILARALLDGAASPDAQQDARELLAAARRRLSYWDVTADDIAQIENTRTPQKTVTLRSPASGIVLEKNVSEGARIMPGMDLYRIADLSKVWIEGEVFEKDLAAVELGSPARITFDAYPGRVFIARVTYVYPTVSLETRTGRVRLELDNPGLQLKPGMYANVEFVANVHIAGLHVPRSAVLATGTRSIVFVRHDDGSLVPHEVTTGVAAGEHIEILSGLSAGQVVVASANFLVDAESNLGAAMQGMPMDMPMPGQGQSPAPATDTPASSSHQH